MNGHHTCNLLSNSLTKDNNNVCAIIQLYVVRIYIHKQAEIERGEADKVIIQSQGQTEFKRKNLGDLGEDIGVFVVIVLQFFGRHQSF